MKIRVLHALSKAVRQTTLDFSLSFGRHIPQNRADASIEYVNPLLSRGDRCAVVNITFVTYELLSLRNTFAWPDVRFRLEEFIRNSQKTVVFPQDDYSASALLDEFISENALIVYSPINNDLEKIYIKSHTTNRFEHALTGYFESRGQEKPEPVTPREYELRAIDLGVRVRNLPSYFGEQGQQKGMLAANFSRQAQARGFQVDFSDDDSQALMGSQWQKFLKKLKFTISSRGGASLTDPLGTVSFWYRQLRLMSDISDRHAFELAKTSRMAKGDFSAVGPRVIDAMANQVGQIQPEDRYLDGFAAGEHYLAIKRDLSNSEEVFAQMRDEKEWVKLVNNSNEFLWSNRCLHYSGFIKGLLKTESPQGMIGRPDGQKVYWGHLTNLDLLDHESHIALNGLIKKLKNKPRALKEAAAKFFNNQGLSEKDSAIAEVTQFAHGLRSGEISGVALINSYLFGLQAVTDLSTSETYQPGF